jgi:UDP-N-acetylmuramoyl-tripeptide--D-alanyl-D-alanine ligase
MNFWNPDNLRSLLSAQWLARPVDGCTLTGLSTDSRAIGPGQVFLAIAGERFDGHAMAGAAAAAGSPVAIVDNPQAMPTPYPPGMGVLKVQSTTRALLKLAAAYRRTLDGARVISVCGSNGKTTTVRMLRAVLSQRLQGTASVKSFNNHIGVPLTILSARQSDQYLVCEVGTNAPGEIAQLSEVVSPDIAVITSIGREHLERLGSLRGVAFEESSVLEFVRDGGMGVVNVDSPELAEVVAGLPKRPAKVLGFGESAGADVRVVSVEQTFDGLTLTLNDRSTFRLPLLGRHNAVNAAAAVAVGRRLGLGDEEIGAGLRSVSGAEMRLERSEIGGVWILNDAYNANPDSMRAALHTLSELGSGAQRRIVILGDMLELGEQTPALHAEIGDCIASLPGLDTVILVGTHMNSAAERLNGRALRLESLDGGGAGEVASLLRPGDLVLIKGSRRMRLERVCAALKARFTDDLGSAAAATAMA